MFKPLTTLKSVFKITNVRFPQMNLPKLKPRLPGAGFQEVWKKLEESRFFPPLTVLALGLALLGLAGALQVFWPAGSPKTQVNVEPGAPVIQEEIPKAALLNEPDVRAGGSPTAPADVPLEIYPVPVEAAPVETVQEEAIVPDKEFVPDWQQIKMPAQGTVTQGYGFHYAEIFDDYRLHPGIDIMAPQGSKVTAALAGVVEAVEKSDFYGRRVIIDHGGQWKSIYSALDKIEVRAGQQVEAGTKIGTIGEPPLAEKNAGIHLHFEILQDGEPIDPQEYLK